MKEELLHYIWQSKLLLGKELLTSEGEPIEILKAGFYNKDAGPDFFNGRLRIGDTVWAGNIEMHLQSSGWEAHRHQHDPAYDNVILHVVYHHDREVYYRDGTRLPTLELKALVPPALLDKYQVLMKAQQQIPCAKIFETPEPVKLEAFRQRLLVSRLEKKCGYLNELLQRSNQHWEQCFYRLTARSFGMKVNAQPFEWLAERLPLQVLAKHRHNRSQIHALVLGMSGLISEKNWPEQAKEADFLLKKYSLQPLARQVWKFSQTRPANFPTVRLPQFADFIYRSSHLLAGVLEAQDIAGLEALYENAGPDGHKLSKEAIHLLLINTVLPALFHYGKLNNQPGLCERALQLYEAIPAEKNAITRLWSQLGLESRTAYDSQAFIELKSSYCDLKNCVHCAIGQNLLAHV